ncbi:hypothetical protein G9A89_011127 [Geosiphon pyriformis]|nr:hypothetical protein G9A89_011127 [Geosiphon pyriformis]
MNKFEDVCVFISGVNSGYLELGVAIIMNNSLASHVCKVSKVSDWILSIKLLFKNKLSVMILGLYVGAFLVVQFSQTGDINSFIAKAMNESSFVIFSGNFNENNSHKCISFRKWFDLGLVNALARSSFDKILTWCNFCGVVKTIDYVFISSNLVNAIMGHNVASVENYFDTNYVAISVSVGLGSLLDVQLFLLHKQANKNCWKFDIKNADKRKWCKFRDVTTANTAMFSDVFVKAKRKKWFKDYDSFFTKESSRFHKLELLVSRLHAEESYIKWAITSRMESFELDKGHIIRNVLEHLFCKVVLDHLVVGNELVLEPDLVKSRVDEIIERWTKKHRVVSDISNNWICQYQPLDYVFDGAFSDVMCLIGFDEMFTAVSNLPNRKAAGLSGISNELEAWILIIPKPYEYRGVFTNTYSIALIKTACKILSKILSNRIFLACSTHEILCEDNFSVLKDITTQLPIFAISLVVENALEKNCKLWLVLQDICKAYDSVDWAHIKKSLVKIKMCDRFIRFFGSIHNDHINRLMTDFELTNGYHVHDELDQKEVFSFLFWCIFYDLFLCEVKRQESMCDYRLNSYFISKSGQAEFQAGLTSFFTAGVFAATQHILNIVGEFFSYNNISINNNKTVAIPINCQVSDSYLTVSGSPISVTKKEELYCYLGIFLSFKGLLKLSLAKTHSDVWFFVNLVLRKAISDKQFAYLVSVVLFPIISYKTQFSFVPISICNKWDALVHRGLKSKFGLLFNFPIDAIYHLSLYIKVNFSNNFLAGMICIFSGCNLSLSRSLASAFHFQNGTSMFLFLANKCLDSHDPIPIWFELSVHFFGGKVSLSACLSPLDGLFSFDVFWSHNFDVVKVNLLCVNTACLSVYTDGSLSGLNTSGMMAGTAAFFEDINLGIDVRVFGIVSSTITELQTIALAFECVLSSRSINLFSDSQAVLDACRLKSVLAYSNLKNWCWVKHCHISNVIHCKNLDVNWIKVKEHSDVSGNKHANALVRTATFSDWHLFYMIKECFLRAKGMAVFGNSRHFIGSGFWIMVDSLHVDIDCAHTADLWSYFMKMLHHHLSVAVCKQLYNRCYSSVICLFCGNIEVSDHIFSCPFDIAGCFWLVKDHLLYICVSDVVVGTALCKSFVFNEWYQKSLSVFKNPKVAAQNIMFFVHEFSVMEKSGLIPHNSSVPVSVFGLPVVLSVLPEVFGLFSWNGQFHTSCFM